MGQTTLFRPDLVQVDTARFNAAIETWCESHFTSLSELGELAGFGRQGLLQLRWKLRKKPSYRMSAKTLRRLSHVTEIPLQELIGSEGAICE
jgi:hypothetical protein